MDYKGRQKWLAAAGAAGSLGAMAPNQGIANAAQLARGQVSNLSSALTEQEAAEKAKKEKKSGILAKLGQVAGTVIGAAVGGPGLGGIVGGALGGAVGDAGGRAVGGGGFDAGATLGAGVMGGLTTGAGQLVGGALKGAEATGAAATELGSDAMQTLGKGAVGQVAQATAAPLSFGQKMAGGFQNYMRGSAAMDMTGMDEVFNPATPTDLVYDPQTGRLVPYRRGM